MKKFIILISLGLLYYGVQAQYTTLANESFTSIPAGWTVSPANSWVLNSNLAVSTPKSVMGFVPNSNGDSVELVSPWYNLTNYAYAFLQFSHICKVTGSDLCQIKYQELAMPGWKVIPTSSYQGNDPTAYAGAKFSQSSYSTWQPGDSLVTPTNTWWKEENFDITGEVSYAQVRFKFIIKKGTVLGSQFAYGWVIDNFKLLASMNQIKPPVVQFLSTSPVDTVYNTGPFTVTAKIATRTLAPIVQPVKLNVKYTYNNVSTFDTINMTMVAGDSIFSAEIPQKIFGTKVSYDVKGMDSVGNDAYAYSGYFIKRSIGGAATGNVIVGTGTSTTYQVPINMYYCYSWTRQLYLANELSLSSSGGLITKIAWQYAYATPYTYTNQTCYFQVVDASVTSITNTSYIDPILGGATQVWSGTANFSLGWVEFTLTKPFMLPPGKNLLVYWDHKNGAYPGTAYVFNYSTTANNMSVYCYLDASFPSGNTGTLTTMRANTRFYIMGGSDDTNSVALYKINNPSDSIIAAPLLQSPVVVTIKNKGMGDLDSCNINWTLNGIPQIGKIWRGHLPDDFNAIDTIGFYTPSVNKFDTLVIWVSSPNGVYDSTTFDDTLTRIAFGVTGLNMWYVSKVTDTLYNTGPFEIRARISSRTATPVPTPVYLHVTYTYNAVVTHDTILMSYTLNDTFVGIIPQHIFGTTVVYSISVLDAVGNLVTITDGFYIKRLAGGASTGYMIAGTGTSTTYQLPMNMFYCYSWTRQLYYANELSLSSAGGLITKLAWQYAYATGYTYTNQTCYFKAVDASVISITNNAYIDPISDGATQVWTGTINLSLGWVEINLTQPFILPPGKNLLIYWNHQHGTYPGSAYVFNYTTTANNTSVNCYLDANFPSANTGTISTTRPNARFYVIGNSDDSNSVALHSLIKPTSSVLSGQITPVITTIKNKGIANLTSCTINWTLNGVLQSPVNWTGNLPEDFNHIDTIGYYTPRNAMFDTLRIWVSSPNGVYDSTYYDDTLQIITFGCGQIFSGNIIVGPDTSTSDYTKLSDFISALKLCGSSGNVTVKMQNGIYTENITIPDLSAAMGSDTLFITSLADNADSVIIQAVTGVALTLDHAKNIYIKNITWDAQLGTFGVELKGTGNNLLIYGCNIKANPTSTSSANAGVYYNNTSSSGKYLVDVRFIKNTITGGYYNLYFYYAASASTTIGLSSISIDSNTLTEAYYAGIYSYYYANFPSISYNKINSRLNTSSAYYGIYSSYYSNIIKLVGNKIRVTGSSTCYGMYLYYYHNYNSTYGANGPGLIANNEIIVLGGSTTACGIYQYYYSNWNITHNTIYVQGTSTCYGLYRYNTVTSTLVNVNKNILVTNSTGTNYPIYISSSTYATSAYGTMDYNDYYASGTAIAYVGSAITSLSALKTLTAQNANSINVKPSFIDSTFNLDLSSYTGFDCPQDAAVLTDINGFPRLTTTTMGAHCLMLVNVNANMRGVVGWETKAMTGRNFGVTTVLQNDGLQALTSVTINWSFNNVVQTPVSWTGSLNSGQNTNIYLGNITFLSGDSNDLVVWVSNPNNTSDMYPTNDTIVVGAIGGPGVIVEFISPYVVDTLLGNTGPYEINARVKRLSQQMLTTPVLNVYTLWQGTPSTANITMTAVSGDSLWKASIPQKAYGSFVQYSITAYDSLGAMASDTGWFYVKRSGSGSGGPLIDSAIVGMSGTSNNYWHPFCVNAMYSWSRSLYMSTDLKNSAQVQTIVDFGWYNNYGTFSQNYVYTRNLKIYMKATNDIAVSLAAYVQPISDGATLVYNGTLTTSLYWNRVKLQIPFILPQNQNLLVYVEDSTGVWVSPYIIWTQYGTSYVSTCRGYTLMTGTTSNSGNLTSQIPITFFGYGGVSDDSNSVALTKIISPTDTAQCFQIVPIQVIIKNKGISNLTSCNINWTRNGVPQTSYHWTGNLPEDFVDTITLATYTPSFGVNENFKIWVSLPNGALDSNNYDDTLSKKSYGYYKGGNISWQSIIEPIDGTHDVCYVDKSALKVRLTNAGTRMVNLSNYPITFYYTITGAVNLQGNTTFKNGVFGITNKEFILDTLNIHTPGTYHLSIYFYCGDDVVNSDDTIQADYHVNTIILPYDNNFSISTNDYKITNTGSKAWYLDTDAVMIPVFGTGLMHLDTASGSSSTITFNSINMIGSSYPTLEFWFAHDNQNATSQDRILIKVSTDGGTSFSTLKTVYRYKSSAFTPIWSNYLVDLLSYSNVNCLVIAIEGISSGGGDLYIDRVKINSNPEIAVSALDVQNISNLTACDLDHKTLSVSVSNNTNQDLDFSLTPFDITINVSDAVNQTYTRSLTSGILPANSEDTYVIETDFDYSISGNYYFTAYVTSIDKFPNNDTVIKIMTIMPDVYIDSIVSTGCEVVGALINKTIYIRNTGNLTVTNVPLRIQVDGTNDITETAAITLLSGERKLYTFTTPYTVPTKSSFVLSVSTELSCDANTSNNQDTMTHCVIEPLVKVTGITDPSTTPCDTAKSKKFATVVLNNLSSSSMTNQIVFLEIDDHKGNVTVLKDTVSFLKSGITNYRFKKAFIVPDLTNGSNYKLTAYIYAPIYGSNTEACVATVGIIETKNDTWTLGQNIPNPAQSLATIPYSLPIEGNVVFKLMTVSGQILYENSIESKSGNNSININTESLSNGIYYYSMEYDGQKIVKKMTIQK